MDMEFAELQIALITIKAGFNPRSSLGDIEELKASIKVNGLINPVTVCQSSKGVYHLIAGARRLEACKELKLTKILATIRNDITVESPEALGLALAENLEGGRQNLLDLDLAKAYQRLYDKVKDDFMNEKERHTEVGKLVGRSYKHVEHTLRVLDAPASLQGKLAEGGISKQAVVTVTEAPEELRQIVADRIMASKDRVTDNDVRKIINDVRRNAASGSSSKVVDLEAEADNGKIEAEDNSSTSNDIHDGDMIVWRSKKEVKEEINRLAQHAALYEKEGEDENANTAKGSLAALLWLTGAIEEAETDTREFAVAYKKLTMKSKSSASDKTALF